MGVYTSNVNANKCDNSARTLIIYSPSYCFKLGNDVLCSVEDKRRYFV